MIIHKKEFNFYPQGVEIQVVSVLEDLDGEINYRSILSPTSFQDMEAGVNFSNVLKHYPELAEDKLFGELYHFWFNYQNNAKRLGTTKQYEAMEEYYSNKFAFEVAMEDKVRDYLQHKGLLVDEGHTWGREPFYYLEIDPETLKQMQELLKN